MHSKPEFSVGKREQIVRIKVGRLIVNGRKIPAEKRMFIADLVIHPAHGHVLIRTGDPADFYQTARICSRGKTGLLQKCKGYGREPRRVDPVVGKTKVRIQRNGAVAILK